MSLLRLVTIAYCVCVYGAHAAECLDVFPDPAASYAASGQIEFSLNSKLIGSDGELTFNRIIDNAVANSCDTQVCTSGPTSSANLLLANFRFSSVANDITVAMNTTDTLTEGEYDDVVIRPGGQLTLNQINGTYVIDTLTAEQNTTLVLDGGDYWVSDLVLEAGARIIVTGAAPVTLYVQDSQFKLNAQINLGQTPANLTLIAYNTIVFAPGVEANGFFYALNQIQLEQNSRITGAVNTANLDLKPGAMITYAATELSTADFGSTCVSSAPIPLPIGHWPMDICAVSGAAGEITDIIAGNNGQGLNGVGVEFQGRYCQAGSFQGTGDVISIPHSDNYQVTEGAVSFWFKVPDLSYSNRRSAGGMGIFSKDSNGFDDGGHLTMWVLSSGAMRVRQQTSNRSRTIQTGRLINEDQWHHLTYTWGSDGMRLYIDGAQAGSSANFVSSLGNNREPIILGGNAWQTGDASSPSNQLRDLFRGQIDDLQLFDQQLSSSQVTRLYNLAEGNCDSCTTAPELTAHWRLDLCSVDGSSDEIVDLLGNSPGVTLGDASTINDGKFCQAGRLAGNGAHIHIADSSAMALTSGTVSFWIKTADLSFSNTPANGGMGLLSRDSRNFDGGGHLTIWVEADGSVEVRHQSTSQSYTLQSPSGLIRENTWHLITYSFGNSRMRLFIDGQLIANNTQYAGGISGNNEPLILGATASVSGDGESTPSQLRDFFKGDFDDIRLYRNELALADVEDLYNSAEYVCTNCTGDRPVAFYQFEQQEYTAPGQVTDSSANAFDADPIGGVSPILPDVPISCRALDVPQNFRVNEIDAINSKLDLNEIGGRGTISLWYRSTNAWIGGNNRQIFDASQLANPPARNNGLDKFFFLVLRNNGRLRFAMEDNTDENFFADTGRINIPANQWVHIALSWDLVNQTAQIFINGNEQTLTIRSDLQTSQIAGLGDLYFGDIGNTYVIVGGTDNSIYGQLDDVRVYNFKQTRAQILADINKVTPCSTVAKYQIVHPQQALTCSTAPVTIKACANDNCTELSDLPTTVSLSPTGWGGGDQVTFIGSTQVDLAQTTAGTTTIGIVSATPDAPVECNPDCNIEFVNAGFEFFDRLNTSSTGLPTIVAENDLNRVGIRALQNENGVCGPLLSGNQTINLNYDCVTTSDAPYSPNQCRRDFADIAITNSGAGINSGTVNVSFNNQGEASLAGFSYADSGRLAISVDAVVDGVTIDSGSATLDSVPASLSLAANANDPHIAGDPFELSITAIGANGSALPGYQPADMQMSLQRLLPANSNVNGGLTYADSRMINSQTSASFVEIAALPFSEGTYRYSQAYFEEAGKVTWDVRDLVYLGETIDAFSPASLPSLELGLFVPAYFDLALLDTGSLADSCSAAFTYVGQAFDYVLGEEPSFRIIAKNALGLTTLNYADALWLLAPDISDVAFADSANYVGNAVVEQAGNVSINGQNVFDGSADFAILGSQFSYQKSALMSEPFESSIDLTLTADFLKLPYSGLADPICYQANYPNGCDDFVIANIRGTEQRYGRLRVHNSYGPETESVFLPLSAEYYANGEWRLNTQDSCTAIDLAESDSDIDVGNASAGQFEQDITALLDQTSSTGILIAGLSDDTDLNLGPPLNGSGEGIRGSVIVTLNPSSSATWSDFLNIDWNLDGAIDNLDTPSGIATFGIYRGNDRTIHWREVF